MALSDFERSKSDHSDTEGLDLAMKPSLAICYY